MAHKDDITTHTDSNDTPIEIVGCAHPGRPFVEVAPHGSILTFTPTEARNLADTLRKAADLAEHKNRTGIYE